MSNDHLQLITITIITITIYNCTTNEIMHIKLLLKCSLKSSRQEATYLRLYNVILNYFV